MEVLKCGQDCNEWQQVVEKVVYYRFKKVCETLCCNKIEQALLVGTNTC